MEPKNILTNDHLQMSREKANPHHNNKKNKTELFTEKQRILIHLETKHTRQNKSH